MATNITTSGIGVSNNETYYAGTATSSWVEYAYERNQESMMIKNTGTGILYVMVENDGSFQVLPGEEKVFNTVFQVFKIKSGANNNFTVVSKNYIDGSVIGETLGSVKADIANLIENGGAGAGLTELTARVDALENPVSISSFTITSPTEALEVGAELTSVSFGWSVANFDSADSANIRDVSANTNIQAISEASGTHTEAVSVTKSAPGTQSYRLDVVAGARTISSTTRTIEWRYASYYGNGGETIDAAGVKALATKILRSSLTGNYTISDATGYKWIVIPKSLTQPSSFKDAGTGFAVAMQAPIDVEITNDEGVSVTMSAYRTTNSFGGAITIEAVA